MCGGCGPFWRDGCSQGPGAPGRKTRAQVLLAVCIPQGRRGGSVSGSTKDRVEKVKTAKEGLCDAKATCMKDVAFLCCTAWQAGAKRSKPLGNKDFTFIFARGKER